MIKSFDALLQYACSSDTQDVAAPSYVSRSVSPEREEITQAVSADEQETPAFDRSQCDKDYVWDLRDAVVNYLRPTLDLGGKATRKQPNDIPLENRKAALLVNDSYPGPSIEAVE